MKNNTYQIVANILMMLLLLICYFKLPYGYYQFIKIVVTFGALYCWLMLYKMEKSWYGIIYLPIAILFNPFVKFALNRNQWQVIDFVVAGILFVVILTQFITEKRNIQIKPFDLEKEVANLPPSEKRELLNERIRRKIAENKANEANL